MTRTESLAELTVATLVERVGAKASTPGGGAVAALTAALAAAISRMVVAYSTGRKSLAEHAALHERALSELSRLAGRALALADEDVAAYGTLAELWTLPEDDPRRRREWAAAVVGAIEAPREMLACCASILDLLRELAGATNPMLRSDLAIGALLAEAGARAAAWNVRVNLPLLDDEARAAELGTEAAAGVEQARAAAAAIEADCGETP